MKLKIKDVFYYIQGNVRYHLYYKGSILKCLLSQHVIEQFEWRLQQMDKECLNKGQCKICGCETTALQMANKACDKPCYPPLMNAFAWNRFKSVIDFKIYKKFKNNTEFYMDIYKYVNRELSSDQIIIRWNTGKQK